MSYIRRSKNKLSMETIELQEKISEVISYSNTVKKDKPTEEDRINAFLDFILKRQEELNTLREKLSGLNNTLYSEINNLPAPYYLIDLKSIRRLCLIIINMQIKSKIYPGIKANTLALKKEANLLGEIIHDIELKYVKFPKNKKIQELLKRA